MTSKGHRTLTDPPLPEELLGATGLMMSRASELFTRLFESALQPYGLRAKDYTVLHAIDAMGPRSQQRLAQVLGIDRTTMVSVVDGLERLGLVHRARDPRDRRRYALELTERGSSLLHDRLAGAALCSADAFFEPLSPDERDQLHRLLWRVVTGPGAAAASAGQGTGHGSGVPGGAGR